MLGLPIHPDVARARSRNRFAAPPASRIDGKEARLGKTETKGPVGGEFIKVRHVGRHSLWWAKGKPRTAQPSITVDHFAFRVDKDTYRRARDELASHRVEIDHESDHGIEQSIYFRDPDGHLVELACYELHGRPEKMPRPHAPSRIAL
jgi:catechol 2,3-dioxygenase-like lactoylglutathione lyase family enzyme